MEFQDDKGKRLDVIRDGVALLEEDRTYRIALQLGDTARAGWRAWFGEMELEWTPDTSSFKVRTGYWAGSQSLRVHGPQGEQHQPVEVLPRKTKLESIAWAQLLRDLHEWIPGSTVGQEGGLHGAVGTIGCDIAGVAAVLGDLVPAFVSALEPLLRSPRERSIEQVTEVPVHAVRQAERVTLRWLMNHPDVYQSVRGYTGERRNGRDALVPQRAWKGDLDHAANRYVVWLTRQIAQQLRATAECVRKALTRRRSLDPELEHWCEGRAQWLTEGANALDSLLLRTPLGALQPDHDTYAATSVLLDDPVYARVHVLGQLFRSPRFQLPREDALLEAPVRPTYELYELWTFLALQRLLEEQLPQTHWDHDGIDKLKFFDQEALGACSTGHWPGRGTLRLYFNLSFPGFLTKQRKTATHWSISATRRPDLVLTWSPEQGPGQWICLDAKYRTEERHVAEAFESVHLYHDSLRWPGLGEQGRCTGAVLLVPAMNARTAPWFQSDFRNEHGVGVFQLTPGQPPSTALVEWVRERLGWVAT